MIGSRARAPASPPSEFPNMDSDLAEFDNVINQVMVDARSRGNTIACSGPRRPFLLPTRSQSPQETDQRLHGDRHTGPKFVFFHEGDTCVAPVASTSTSCAGASSSPYSISNEPYRVMIKEPINRKSETSRACAGARIASRQDNEPKVTIVEQPKNSKRFRYDSEISSAGVIRGVEDGKNGKKSYPAIKILNYEGSAVITVSLVCADYPHRVHPNGLVGKKKTSNTFTYICVRHVEVTRMNCKFQFDDLGIRLVKPEQVDGALKLREEQKVDPYNQGYTKRVFLKSDLHKVRLCFHVWLATQKRMLPPEVSDIIYDFNMFGCLQIKILCNCSGSEKGGPQIILVCGRLNPKDIEVIFYEEENNNVVWQQTVKEVEVYGCMTIVCAVPAYTRAAIEYDKEVHVNIRLRRPSNDSYSDPRPFTYYADNKDSYYRNKRKMIDPIIRQYATEKWTPPEVDCASQPDQDWRKMPRPFDVNPVATKPSCISKILPKPSECRETMKANIPISLDVEPVSSASKLRSEAEDDYGFEFLTVDVLDSFDPLFFENLDI